MDLKELKSTLETFKGEVVEQIKSGKGVSEEQLNKAIADIESKNQKTLDEYDAKRKLSVSGLEEEKKNLKFQDVVVGQLKGVMPEGVTKEALDFVAKSNNTTTGANGSYLIPDEMSSDIIDLAMPNTPFGDLGLTRINGLRGNFSIPKLTGRPTAYWVGEEEAPADSKATFGNVNFNKKTLAVLTKVSEDLIYQSSGVAESIIRREMANTFAIKMTEGMLFGTGSSSEIKGLANFSEIGTSDAIGTNGGRFEYADAGNMITDIELADRLKNSKSLGFLMRPESKQSLKAQTVEQYSGQGGTNGMPIIMPFTNDEAVSNALNGYKIATTTLMKNDLTKGSSTTCSRVYFGDWSQFVLAMWEGFEMRSSMHAGDSSGSAYTQRQIWLLAFQGMDTGLRDGTALTKISDAETDRTAW